jgi:hypothetical protein
MAKAKRNSARKSKAGPGRKRKQKADVEGDHVRSLAPPAAVKSYIKECIASKNTTSEEGQRLSTATKRALDQGVNVPMARICARLYNKAVQDPLKGRVNWEDLVYYMLECTDFERIAPAGMFSAEEGGQKRSRKRGSKQEELPVDEPPEAAADEAVVVH